MALRTLTIDLERGHARQQLPATGFTVPTSCGYLSATSATAAETRGAANEVPERVASAGLMPLAATSA